jgi:TPR repeat protein
MRALSFALLTTIGCGAGTAAEVVRPKETTAASALGQAECADVASGAEPLVVDWKPEQRGDLEVAMKDGVAVVSYSCKGIKLLADCKLDGKYGYIGMTRKEQVLQLTSSDELQANLPLTGSQLSAGLERGSSLDVAMIMVGKRRTTWARPNAGDLTGECAGATHYVRGATVGAFALASGTHANVRASAQIFAAGTQGASASAKDIKNRDGDPAACEKASPDADAPPPQCGAPVRLVLAPIAPKPAAGAAESAPAAATAETEPTQAVCPAGLVESGGKCTKPEAAPSFQCKPGDADGCKQQCDKGHAGSCRELAELLARSSSAGSAAAPAQKACEAGEARACTVLGQLARAGTGVAKDDAAAGKWLEMGCSGGDGAGCTALGKLSASDGARSLLLFEKGCSGGDVAGCAAAGAQHLGTGAPGAKRETLRARDFLSKACDGGDAASCASLGALYDAGDPQLPKQPILAEMMLRRGCMRGAMDACGGLGMLLLSKQGGNPNDAKMQLERACLGRDVLACAALKVAFGDARPVPIDVKQRMALNTACMGGSARACANVALLDAASGNTVAAKPNLTRACSMGDAWGCFVQSKVGK